MQLPTGVEPLEKTLSQLIVPYQTEDDHAEVSLSGHLKATVSSKELLKGARQTNALAYVRLQATDAVVAQNEPQFEGPKAFA